MSRADIFRKAFELEAENDRLKLREQDALKLAEAVIGWMCKPISDVEELDKIHRLASAFKEGK